MKLIGANMSKKNSLEEKSKRRALRRIEKSQNNAPVTSKQMWIKTKDRYGREKLEPVMMPVSRRAGMLNRRAR